MTDQIAEWLGALNLGHLASVFEENEVALDDLPLLSDEDLKELGIALGPRRRLLKALADGTQFPSISEGSGVGGKAPVTEAERRHLTVMFVDLVGSVELSARLDPEDMRDVIRSYQDASAGVITRFDGHIAKYMGDGILAYFGWPRAHEDEAERACRAAMALVDAVATLEPAPDVRLEVRIGIASGLVVVGDLIGEGAAQEQSVVGDVPNLAARLQTLAAPGSVLLSAATSRLTGDVFDLRNLRQQSIKGLSDPVDVFEIVGKGTTRSRFEARSGPAPIPMVGRDQELALLMERWARAKSSEGQGVLLVGEAGIGKSRISKALLDSVAQESHTRLRYQCSPYHTDSALWPVVEQLRHAAGFTADDREEQRLDKLEALLSRAGEIGEDTAPLVAHLLGLDGESRYGPLGLSPSARRSRTLDALINQVLGLANEAPVLMLLEDAHWIDPTMLELIEQTLDLVAGHRVLIVLTSRPDNQPALAGHPDVTRLTLNRLGKQDVAAIVTGLGGDRLSPESINEIVARTDGVPLFVEELTKAVVETGELEIPASLHDSLMARLDRIREVKEVAQIAAVIGREFDYRLLSTIAEMPEPKLEAGLDKLAEAEIVFRRGAPPDARYTFKHALVQDAAYQSLLKSKRRDLHAATARALESGFEDIASTQPELIAHHFTEAGMAGPAIHYWQRAAGRAMQQSANLEAIAHYEQALALMTDLPASPERDVRELDLRLGLGAALIAPRSYAAEEVHDAFARAEELSRGSSDIDRRFRALRGLWHWHFLRAQLSVCESLSVQISELAAASADPARRLMAGRIAGSTLAATGHYEDAARKFEQGLLSHDPTRQHAYVLLYGEDPGLVSQIYLAWLNDWLGYRDQAVDWLGRSTALARSLPHRYSLCFVLTMGAWTHKFRSEIDETYRMADEAVQIAAEQDIGQWLGTAQVAKGWALASRGQLRDGLDLAKRGYDITDAQGTVFQAPLQLSIIAEIHCMAHEYEDALRYLDSAEAVLSRTNNGLYSDDVYRRRGSVQAALSRDDEAERDFQTALDIARARTAKTFELKAAYGLAQLWHRQGKTDDARALLPPVYDWFTEGFDTKDLKDAKSFLEELP